MIKIALPNGKYIEFEKKAEITPREAREYRESLDIGLPAYGGLAGGAVGSIGGLEPAGVRGFKARALRALKGGGRGALIGLGIGALAAPILGYATLGPAGREALREYKVKKYLEERPKWIRGLTKV